MKKSILICLILPLCISIGKAQEDMVAAWTAKLDHKSDMFAGLDDTGEENYCFGASDKAVTVLNNKDGSVLWAGKYKDLTPKLKKIDEIIPMWGAQVLFLFDRKTGKDQIACLDVLTGKLLWNTDQYQKVSEDNVIYIREMDAFALSLKDKLVMVKARTGEELWATTQFKGAIGKYLMMDDGSLVMVNFKPTFLAAMFVGFKNQIIKIDSKNGDVLWESSYLGMAEKKVISKESLVGLDSHDGKIFLFINGLQVYDYQTGANLWSAAYDFTVNCVKAPPDSKKFGVYGAVADPVIQGNDLYIVKFESAKKQKIQKFDLNSGKLLWTSPEIKEAKAIPNMYVAHGRVVIQQGGAVEAQALIKRKEKNADGSFTITTIKRIWHPNVKPYGIQSFDSKDGSLVYDSERFKKGITNCLVEGKNLIVCSGKALYSLDLVSGKDNYEMQLGDDGIGKASIILEHKGDVLVVGEKGVAKHKTADGKLVASSKYKKADFAILIGRTLLVETEKADIAAFDTETVSHRRYNAKKDAQSMLARDGEHVFVYEKKNISKLKTH
jgi:outer membrane protein assembly factor BamB